VRLLTIADGMSQWVAAQARTVLSSGENRLSVALPPLHSLSVSASEGVQGKIRPYSVERRAFWNWNVAVNFPAVTPTATGLARFQRVPAGRYIVVLPGSASKSDMIVDVPAAGTVEFKHTSLNALEIVVTDPEGVLAAAGARTGDRIVAVNRETFENRARFRALVTENRESDSVALSLERSGLRTIVHIPGQALIYGYNLGARLIFVQR
jgi:hypothetical protein